MFDLKTALEHYNPLSSHEQQIKVRMLAFLASYPDCFERTLEIGHFTASAWLLNNDETHALLMHHNKLDMWLQLGGHCDGNKDVLAVAIKEAQEESGIEDIVPLSSEIFDIDIHLVPAYKHEPAHYHYDVRFLLKVDSVQSFKRNNEAKELRWIPAQFHELPTQERSVTRMFDKWIAQRVISFLE